MAIQPAVESLHPRAGQSFRFFERSALRVPARWHRHPEIELTYVAQGSGARVVGDHVGSYGNHDLVLVGSQLPHTWRSDEYRSRTVDLHPAFVIQFHPDFVGREFFALPEMQKVQDLLRRSERGLLFPRETAMNVADQQIGICRGRSANPVLALLQLLHVLADAPARPLAAPNYQFGPSPAAEDRMARIDDYLSRNISNPDLSQTDVANLLDLTPSGFSRFFRNATGRTLSEHIHELRIGLACRLLATTDLSVLEVSLASGFANLSNFNRRFRTLRMMTPSDYRTQCRQNLGSG